MIAHQITKLAEKYTPKEITTAVKVLVDILDVQEKGKFCSGFILC